jgi:carbonic anhydrase
METFSDEIMSTLLDDSLATANFDGKAWSNPKHGGGSVCGHFINWHTIKDQPKSVLEDVMRIRTHPLVPGNIPIYGFVYDVATGRLNEVEEASAAGRPTA